MRIVTDKNGNTIDAGDEIVLEVRFYNGRRKFFNGIVLNEGDGFGYPKVQFKNDVIKTSCVPFCNTTIIKKAI